MALASDNPGLALWLAGEYDESERYLQVSLKIARGRGDDLRTARLLNNLATTQLALQPIDAAAESGAEAVRLHRSVEDWRGLAYAYDILGVIRVRQNDPAVGIGHFQAPSSSRPSTT